MMRFTVVVREIGSFSPDYSLEFEAGALPRAGDYLSVRRPDVEGPCFGEDLIVRRVWWRLDHPETAPIADDVKVGRLNEIFVECDPALGPWSTDRWRQRLEAAKARGIDVHDFELERFTIRQADLARLRSGEDGEICSGPMTGGEI